MTQGALPLGTPTQGAPTPKFVPIIRNKKKAS